MSKISYLKLKQRRTRFFICRKYCIKMHRNREIRRER